MVKRLKLMETFIARRRAMVCSVIALVLVLAVVVPESPRACSCNYLYSPMQALFRSDAVFSGIISSYFEDSCGTHLTIDVTRVWQGVDSCQMEVVTEFCPPSACGFGCGGEVMVYAEWAVYCTDTVLYTGLCHGSGAWSSYHESQLPPSGAGVGYSKTATWGSRGSLPGQLEYPRGIALDAAGNVYVADTGNHRIQKWTGSGAYITSWGSEGSGDGEFSLPWDVDVAPNGNVYVVDLNNLRIQYFTADGLFLGKWGSFGTADGQFSSVESIAINSTGEVYVGDVDRIQKFSGDGTWIATWSVAGHVSSIDVGPSDDVFITSPVNGVQRFTPEGTLVATFDSLCGIDESMLPTQALAVDVGGDIFSTFPSLAYPSRILHFTADGTLKSGWVAHAAYDIAVVGAGEIVYATTQNHTVEAWTPRTIATSAPDVEVSRPADVWVFPNPFNPSVTISIELRRREALRADIYDVHGRRVRQIFAGMDGPGVRTWVWDGQNDRGNAVATGMYLLRVQRGATVETRKLVLLK